MKKRIKEFLFRGLICGGFGPLVYGIVMLIIDSCGVDSTNDGVMIFKGIISTYIIAFLVAGVSIIWQEEKLGLGLSIFIHGSILYLCYLSMYLINGWILSENILVFSLIFVFGYALVWSVIYSVETIKMKKMNQQLSKHLS